MDRMGMPYVLIDRELRGLDANYVGIDDETAGRMATEHLIDQGCKVIAHIREPENSAGTQRFVGYKNALKRHGIKYSESLVVDQLSMEVEASKLGADAMRTLLRHKPVPDGVFAYNDALAIGAIDAILEAGLPVPEDIAVIGCGNLHYNGSLRVPLSSIDQNSL
jgi:LacI family transcriptional regulator